ncbi:MG2 domain-containing protein [bacterium]|nr:MG2 domain-containing protein [bacterium]
MRHLKILTTCILIFVGTFASKFFIVNASAEKEKLQDRGRASLLMSGGNYKEAYDVFSALAFNPKNDSHKVADDMREAVRCLNQLGRVNEFDDFIEKVISIHKDNFLLLEQAAQLYMGQEHNGSIIAGKFVRGPHRGASKVVNSYERDRVRALQLYSDAIQKSLSQTKTKQDSSQLGRLYLSLSQALLFNRGWQEAWRLQYLTDLNVLPDYEDGYFYGYYGYGGFRGAPVNPDGSPVFHKIPKSWEVAETDGERYRWCINQAMEYSPDLKGRVLSEWADFLHNQFGVATMSEYRGYFVRFSEDDSKKNESGPYAVHTLKENETIARLATGIKRFNLPDEYNYIKIYQEVASAKYVTHAGNALDKLATIFENRLQYEKAADYWRQSIDRYGDQYKRKENRLNQIVKNWGQFQPTTTQSADTGATIEYKFRNGHSVVFTAYEVDIQKLLADLKSYLKSKPKTLDWDKMNIQDVGYRLITKNQKEYIGKQVASWELKLQPKEKHFDKVITVTTPLQKSGAYLLTAKMEDGNTSNSVIWVSDTVILKKPLDNGVYYFVADAKTGKPISGANLEFFGYRQRWQERRQTGQAAYDIYVRHFAELTDKDGQVFAKIGDQENYHQWIVTATTKSGRFAYLGFTDMWISKYHDYQYNQVKYYFMSDRPVYRPEQVVKFKWWVGTAKYDQEGKSEFSGKYFNVRIDNPKGEKVFEKQYTSDEFGGIDGEFLLAKDVTLGVYRVNINNRGYATFRVEEYKKPEFEVIVTAPVEPIMLGEKVTAKIEAKYYFGAPVTEGKIKYKVLRTSYPSEWFPPLRWDWLYGKGYGWLGYDYTWYPRWNEWGCFRPIPRWRPFPRSQPELVAEVEVPIGKDGLINVEIDTSPAKELMGDTDHRYEITVEVTDLSRRTITGQGTILVARKPFKVYLWTNRGHYRVGDVIKAEVSARTLNNKPVEGKGVLRLLKVTYPKGEPKETEVMKWNLNTNVEGNTYQQLKASQAGQYRLSYTLKDNKGHTIEGGYIFCVRGEGFTGEGFRFEDIELVPDKTEYSPGEKVNLAINTNRLNSYVLLFVRPSNGVYLPPKILSLEGKSVEEEIEVLKKDMPNFFVEAVTVSNGKVYQEMRELVVPPESRILNVYVEPSSKEYKPGEKGVIKLKVTDASDKPYSGSCVVTMYDKSVEYISGGTNVVDIKEFFWKWIRHHNPTIETSLNKRSYDIPDKPMLNIGVFGHLTEIDGVRKGELSNAKGGMVVGRERAEGQVLSRNLSKVDAVAAPMSEVSFDAKMKLGKPQEETPLVEPSVRSQFADTALWVATVTTDNNGEAELEVKMPDNLTTWKTRVWAMGEGSRVGEGTSEIVTTKNLIIRLQSPRFFIEKDEVVLSANVHNYLKGTKKVDVILETEGGCLSLMKGYKMTQKVNIKGNSETRVDWRLKVIQPGTAVVRMKALTNEESDAMELSFPVYVHGMLKTESWSGYIRPEESVGGIEFYVPTERRPEETRLEVRYSPSLASAMVDALPYMADYPYKTTESTLNRFLPSVITQKVLKQMGLNLKDIEEKRTNLNAQEIGIDKERAKQWKRFDANPVFDEEQLNQMVKAGIERLTTMQNPDGGWGWFSGWGERSWPHTTATVVRGLQVARANGVGIVPGVVERGVEWLNNYQKEQVVLLKNKDTKDKTNVRWRGSANNLDALVYMVLVNEKIDNIDMRNFLYRDRNNLSVYGKGLFGLALHNVGDIEKRDMLIRNINQYLVIDNENQTAYLRMPEGNYWWYWYGNEIEANAYYLKLLVLTDPKGEVPPYLVKYLLNNRKHATYWNSTRDTALVVEAFSDYIKATGEDDPDMNLIIKVAGKEVGKVDIKKDNLFTYNNKLVLIGDEVVSGKHKFEILKKGRGPLYFNAYLTNFTLEDPIKKAGLEIKVERKYYRLVKEDKTIKAEGMRGQVLEQKVEKYIREELKDLATLKSGELVEVELKIDSKNDYEYIIFEDMKPAGFEPVEVRSGYGGNEMDAYMEFRDEKVSFLTRVLPRGTHSLSYRIRAEIPGKFSALPTKASGMYAPELKANSDEIKLQVKD